MITFILQPLFQTVSGPCIQLKELLVVFIMSSSTVFYLVLLVLYLAGTPSTALTCTRNGAYKIPNAATDCIGAPKRQSRIELPGVPDPEVPTEAPTGATSAPPGDSSAPPGETSAPPGATGGPPGATSAPPEATSVPPGATSAPPGETGAPTNMTTTPPKTTPSPAPLCHYYVCVYYPRFNTWTVSTHKCREHSKPNEFVAEFDESRRRCVHRRIPK